MLAQVFFPQPITPASRLVDSFYPRQLCNIQEKSYRKIIYDTEG